MVRLPILLLAVVFAGCMVPKSDYNNLKLTLDTLKHSLDTLKASNVRLRKQVDSIHRVNKSVQQRNRVQNAGFHSEDEALALVKDYYEFYNAEMTYRNPKIRRISNNEFYVSLEECTNKEMYTNDEFFWRSTVHTLVINSDGKYLFR